MFTTNRFNAIYRDGEKSAINFFESLVTKSFIKWIQNNFFGGSLQQFNDRIVEIGTTGTTIHDRIFTPTAGHRTFTGIQYLTDLISPANFYSGTRVNTKLTLYEVNELNKLKSFDTFQASYFENSLPFLSSIYYDKYGRVNFVHGDLNGETWHMENLDDRKNLNAPFDRDALDTYFSHINNRDFLKNMYGDYIRYLGYKYGSSAGLSFYLESAGMVSLKYLLYKPFDILGLRAQYHVPVINVVPAARMSADIIKSINNDRDFHNLIPPAHYTWVGGEWVADFSYYENGIPEGAKLRIIDWYRDIMMSSNSYVINRMPTELQDWSKEHGYSFAPMLEKPLYETLRSAQLLCADQNIYQLDNYQDFFKKLMTIDWAAINGNYNTDNFNERLGLTEEQARELVLAFGLKWNSNLGAAIEFISQAAQQWWLDFANSRDYYLTDRTTGNPSSEKNHWAEISLYIMYQRISNMQIGSGQGF